MVTQLLIYDSTRTTYPELAKVGIDLSEYENSEYHTVARYTAYAVDVKEIKHNTVRFTPYSGSDRISIRADIIIDRRVHR